MKLVLDSSVLAKLFLDEQGSDSAIELMELGESMDLEFLASDLAIYEVGNAILRNLGKKKKDGGRYLRLLYLLNIEFIPINVDLAYESMRNAQNYKITYYDGIHATLSKNNKTVLITQDKELLKKIGWAESIDNFLNRIEKIE